MKKENIKRRKRKKMYHCRNIIRKKEEKKSKSLITAFLKHRLKCCMSVINVNSIKRTWESLQKIVTTGVSGIGKKPNSNGIHAYSVVPELRSHPLRL